MKHTTLFGGLAALALTATIAWAASLAPASTAAGIGCLSEADVAAQRHRSRNGIALSCREAMLRRQDIAERAR